MNQGFETSFGHEFAWEGDHKSFVPKGVNVGGYCSEPADKVVSHSIERRVRFAARGGRNGGGVGGRDRHHPIIIFK